MKFNFNSTGGTTPPFISPVRASGRVLFFTPYKPTSSPAQAHSRRAMQQRPRARKQPTKIPWKRKKEATCLLDGGASCRIRTNDPEITNHVLWPTELKRRVGKLLASRRYNQLPLLRSRPGGFEGSWPCKTCPCKSECKGTHFLPPGKVLSQKKSKKAMQYLYICDKLSTFALDKEEKERQ